MRVIGGDPSRPGLAAPTVAQGACRKLWRRPQNGQDRASISHFVNLWKTETRAFSI